MVPDCQEVLKLTLCCVQFVCVRPCIKYLVIWAVLCSLGQSQSDSYLLKSLSLSHTHTHTFDHNTVAV